MSDAAVVSLDGVSVSYGEVQALRDVSLEIRPGPVGLLGPNGAGKTTLLRVLLGFVTPVAGTARIAGLDPARRDERFELRSRIGYMPESDALLPGTNGVELVTTLGRLNGLPASDAMTRAHEVLDYVGFGETRYRPVVDYSTGWKQRLKLAQALVHDPSLLLLDEPTNGLDPKGRQQMLDLIVDLAERHEKSVLLCSHLLPDVERTCGRVIVLDEGRTVQVGEMEEITAEVQGTWRVEVVLAEERAALCEALLAAGFDAAPEKDARHLEVRLPGHRDADPLFRAARGAGVAIKGLDPVRPSLQDVFLGILERKGAAAG